MKAKAILQIMKLLTNNAKVSAIECARECEVSTRTIYRYVDELTCAGIPINVERGRYGGISLDKNYRQRNYNYFVTSPEYIKHSHKKGVLRNG